MWLENGRGDRYTYDPEGQLTAASYEALTPNATPTDAQRTDSFHYDQLGNRMGINVLATRGTITFHGRDNGLNQYLDWSPYPTNYDASFAPSSPGHANGNLVQDGWLSADYNALNQPLWFWSNLTVPSGYGLYFGFDPLGRRVKQWGDAPATYFYYDGWSLIQEGPNAATVDRIYAHGNRVDEIVADQGSIMSAHQLVLGTWSYHHYDARGHCILLTNAGGNLVEQYDYDAFGKPYFFNSTGQPLNSSTAGNRFLFTGREWIKEIAVYDFRNRHYLPELGRFIQPDPKEFAAGDYNLYRYCHNDPINRSDPFGLLDIKWKESGNTTDPKTENHYTDEKLRANDKPAAGKTTAELSTSGNKDKSVTADLKVDWKVRKEQALQDPKLAPREKEHPDAWHDWVNRRKSPNSDVSKYFRDKNYASPEEAAKAVRSFLEPYRRNEYETQKRTMDCQTCSHNVDYHLKD